MSSLNTLPELSIAEQRSLLRQSYLKAVQERDRYYTQWLDAEAGSPEESAAYREFSEHEELAAGFFQQLQALPPREVPCGE